MQIGTLEFRTSAPRGRLCLVPPWKRTAFVRPSSSRQAAPGKGPLQVPCGDVADQCGRAWKQSSLRGRSTRDRVDAAGITLVDKLLFSDDLTRALRSMMEQEGRA